MPRPGVGCHALQSPPWSWLARLRYASHALGPEGLSSSLGRLAILAVLVTLGIVIYLASLQLLGVMKLKDMAAAVRRRT